MKHLPFALLFSQYSNFSLHSTKQKSWYFFFTPINPICVLPPGVVHSGVCACVPAGKVYEKSLFWTTESCRNGGSYFITSKRKKSRVSLMSFQFKYSSLTFSLLSAPNRALLVCGDRDVPGLHRVQGRLLPTLCCPLHPPALPQVLPLAGWRPGGLCEWSWTSICMFLTLCFLIYSQEWQVKMGRWCAAQVLNKYLIASCWVTVTVTHCHVTVE